MTHPAELNHALFVCVDLISKLIEDAEKRNDQVGAQAWKDVKTKIESAEDAAREARQQQTWNRR